MGTPSLKRYIVLVWITGLLCIPLSLALSSLGLNLLRGGPLGNSISYESWEWFGMMAISFAMLMVPTWLLFAWMVYYVCKHNAWGWNRKWVIFALGSAIVGLNWLIFSYILFVFWVPFSAGVFLYRLPNVEKDNEETA